MDNKETVHALVTEVLPAGLYKVLTDEGKELICYLGGKLKMNQVRVLIGDQVDVLPDPYKGKTTNRITWIYRDK